MSNIHDFHNGHHPAERSRMEDNAETQERIVLKMLRGRPDKYFAFFEIKQITGWDKDSVKRSLSNLSGSNKRHRDANGRYPVCYHKDVRKENPESETTCGTYKVNPLYGSKPEQATMFPENPKSRAYQL